MITISRHSHNPDMKISGKSRLIDYFIFHFGSEICITFLACSDIYLQDKRQLFLSNANITSKRCNQCGNDRFALIIVRKNHIEK